MFFPAVDLLELILQRIFVYRINAKHAADDILPAIWWTVQCISSFLFPISTDKLIRKDLVAMASGVTMLFDKHLIFKLL